MTIAERLKYAMQRQKKSIRRLHLELKAAKVRGASYANVHAYVGGRREPSVGFLRAAAGALQVRESWLISDDGMPTQVEEKLRSNVTGIGESELLERRKLAVLFERDFPEYKGLPAVVAEAVKETFRRYVAGLPDAEAPVRTLSELFADIRRLLLLPFWNWGFRHQLSDAEFTNYAIGILNALMLILPAPGQGDPLSSYRPKRTPITEKSGKPVGWDLKAPRSRTARRSARRRHPRPLP